jgi:hypothetical protein
MANLGELMKGRVAELLKGPVPVPVADYPATITKFELVTARDGRDSPILRMWVRLLDWPKDDSVSDQQKAAIENISQRSLYCDYWFPLDRRYAQLCKGCGIEGDISEKTNYELVGKHVLAIVKHQVSKKTGETWAIATSLIGSEA